MEAIRTLVVEDEKRIADFLSRGLESAGYKVDLAYDGQSAIDVVHSTDHDLVILDLNLLKTLCNTPKMFCIIPTSDRGCA